MLSIENIQQEVNTLYQSGKTFIQIINDTPETHNVYEIHFVEGNTFAVTRNGYFLGDFEGEKHD